MLRYTTDRARPGLVALYDIQPGNGAGQFLQPRSPHGAITGKDETVNTALTDLHCTDVGKRNSENKSHKTTTDHLCMDESNLLYS